jgi:hypothetical protein
VAAAGGAGVSLHLNQSGAFNHIHTPFPLTGAHTSLPCSACHLNNVFAGTPTTCVACHLRDYNNANNPPHKSERASRRTARCATAARSSTGPAQ